MSSALVAQSRPQVTIRVPVRLVNVPTLVFSMEGRVLPGLERTDFRVLDNGQPQQVALDTASAPVSVALAVQLNEAVRAYVPFIAKAGGIVDTLLVGEPGRCNGRNPASFPQAKRIRRCSRHHRRGIA